MASMNEDWYEKASEFWEEIPETSYLEDQEIREIYPTFLDFLADVNSGMQPSESEAFGDLMDYFGWDYDTFDWDDFREWYDSV